MISQVSNYVISLALFLSFERADRTSVIAVQKLLKTRGIALKGT